MRRRRHNELYLGLYWPNENCGLSSCSGRHLSKVHVVADSPSERSPTTANWMVVSRFILGRKLVNFINGAGVHACLICRLASTMAVMDARSTWDKTANNCMHAGADVTLGENCGVPSKIPSWHLLTRNPRANASKTVRRKIHRFCRSYLLKVMFSWRFCLMKFWQCSDIVVNPSDGLRYGQ